MEPARSPDGSIEGDSEEAYEDIIREASQRLITSAAKKQAPRSTDTASEVAGVKYEVDQRRRYVGTAATRPAFRLTPLRITTMALAVIGLLSWARLMMIGTDTLPPPVDSTYAEASMRWAMVLTSKRVDEFRRVNHHAPRTLSEIGALPTPLIGYERVSDDRYRLTGPTPNGPLVLDSIGSRYDFLGKSLETLREYSMVKR